MVGVLALLLIIFLILSLFYFDKRKLFYGGIVATVNVLVVTFIIFLGYELNFNKSEAFSMGIIGSLILLSGTVTICTLKIIEEINQTKNN